MIDFNATISNTIEKINKINEILDGVTNPLVIDGEEINLFPFQRLLRIIRSRLKSIGESAYADETVRTNLEGGFYREISAISRRLTNVLRQASEEDFIKEALKNREYVLTFSRLARDILEEVSLKSRENNERHEKLISIDETYARVKIVSDEILKEYEKLSFFTSKIKEQQSRISELEQHYRKSIKMLTYDEESFKNKQADIERGYTLSTSFLENASEVDLKLTNLTNSTSDFEGVLSKIETRSLEVNNIFESKLADASKLLEKAKDALGSATTVSLGGHFKDQYDKSKKGAIIWVITGGLFLIGAIIQCLVAVTSTGAINDQGANDVHYLISRLLIAPLFLVGAWFCANQYVKQKNIIEDYAYKKVLSLSLLSIKSEIEKTGEHNTTEFIRAVQNEIMKSPLDSLDRKNFNKEMKMLRGVHSETVRNMILKLSSQGKNQKRKNKNKEVNITKD